MYKTKAMAVSGLILASLLVGVFAVTYAPVRDDITSRFISPLPVPTAIPSARLEVVADACILLHGQGHAECYGVQPLAGTIYLSEETYYDLLVTVCVVAHPDRVGTCVWMVANAQRANWAFDGPPVLWVEPEQPHEQG